MSRARLQERLHGKREYHNTGGHETINDDYDITKPINRYEHFTRYNVDDINDYCPVNNRFFVKILETKIDLQTESFIIPDWVKKNVQAVEITKLPKEINKKVLEYDPSELTVGTICLIEKADTGFIFYDGKTGGRYLNIDPDCILVICDEIPK
jgi:hypothetical protein